MDAFRNLSLENLPREEWRDVVGYEGLYQVSNLGRVKSLERESNTCYSRNGKSFTYIVKERICKQSIVQGYCKINLSKESKKTMVAVHRLVAESFIPNLYNLPQINHIDENKTNNCVSNLELCTSVYNNNYGSRNSRISDTQRGNRRDAKPIYQFSLDGNFIREWDSITEAGRNGYDRKGISNMCHGYKNFHSSCGFIWKFADSIKTLF